tara:strand:+ start:197 stop:460 length:264 start_codon:yes stop_codon:yes gene_type:complete
MAKIKTDEKEVEIEDNSEIKEICEDELETLIACSDGTCGVCKIEVLEGMENLNDINEKEKEMGCEGNERLACQCKIKSGEIKIKNMI